MQANGEQVALLVDGELTGELAASRNDLQDGELTSGCVDLEVDERVGGDGDRRVVEVRDGGAVLSAGRNNEVVGIRLAVCISLDSSFEGWCWLNH